MCFDIGREEFIKEVICNIMFLSDYKELVKMFHARNG